MTKLEDNNKDLNNEKNIEEDIFPNKHPIPDVKIPKPFTEKLLLAGIFISILTLTYKYYSKYNNIENWFLLVSMVLILIYWLDNLKNFKKDFPRFILPFIFFVASLIGMFINH